MGVTIRQKIKGEGQPWYVFITTKGRRTSRKVGSRHDAEKIKEKLSHELAVSELMSWIEPRVEAEKKSKEDAVYEIINLLSARYNKSNGNRISNGVNKIYFIQEGIDGPIKIGVATKPMERLSNLQCGNPTKLRLLYAKNEKGHFNEQEEHYKFGEYRIRGGEWFKPALPLLQYVKGFLEHEMEN